MSSSSHRDTSRLEGFSDAVFAFAATLLVVSLEVPRDFDALVSQLYGFLPFAITFGALVAIWTIHKAFYRRYRLADKWTVLLNSALIFVVLFYVFPLKFLTESFFAGVLGLGSSEIGIASIRQLQIVFMLYSAGFCAIFLCVVLLYTHAWRSRHALALTPGQAWEAAVLARHYGLFFLTGLLSVMLAATGWVHYGLPGLIYFLLGPLCFVHGVWSERRRPKNSGDAAVPERPVA